MHKKKRLKPSHYKKRSKYITELDIAFGKYIKLRDCLWTAKNKRWGYCISCGRPCSRTYNEDIDPRTCGTNGHFVNRGITSLRWDLRNNNLQCRYCNEFLQNKGDTKEAYRAALNKKWGAGTAAELESQTIIVIKFPKTELLELTDFYKKEFTKLWRKF